MYASPVYTAAFFGFLPESSASVERYSEAAIDIEAAIPVINPTIAINFVSLSARVKPANAPVNSTRPSFTPKTTEPRYFFFTIFFVLKHEEFLMFLEDKMGVR